MLQIGSLVDGKYKILSEIGRGGMSVVYMAINEKANKTWAVKEVRKDGVMDFEAVKQGLIVETDMLKKFNHPNLPSIIDVIEDDKSFLIVMDYIEGFSLKKQLKEYGAQPQHDVIKWAKQLCDVLGYLHSREPAIIYRDMKPANIMLKPDGSVMLIDFGTAREFKEKNIADTICLGTIGYAAPEQFGGMGQTDGRTDIYCLGATLYHLVTGCNPSEPPYEMRPIRQINPSLSSGLEQIITKCTQRNPDDRYQSAAELMYALEHYNEFDGIYRKKQKRKLGTFIASGLLTVAFGIGGMVLGSTADGMANDDYETKLFEAESAASYEEKVDKFLQCMEVPNMAGRKDAYLGLLQTYKEDKSFSAQEAEQLSTLLADKNNELLKDSEAYADLCYEIGKMYWYHYEYETSDQPERAKRSIMWFNRTQQYGSAEYANLGTAKAYANIGQFYQNIEAAIAEAADAGMYSELFRNMMELVNQIASDSNEPEIVRLEILELSRKMLEQYATYLKRDGVTGVEALSFFETISNTVQTVNTASQKSMELKEGTVARLQETKEKLLTAYGT